MANEKLREAIAWSKAGEKAKARELLQSLIESDPTNEMAWIWMTDTTESEDERRYCLEIVLSLNPNSAPAQAGLRVLGGSTPPPEFEESALPKGWT